MNWFNSLFTSIDKKPIEQNQPHRMMQAPYTSSDHFMNDLARCINEIIDRQTVQEYEIMVAPNIGCRMPKTHIEGFEKFIERLEQYYAIEGFDVCCKNHIRFEQMIKEKAAK